MRLAGGIIRPATGYLAFLAVMLGAACVTVIAQGYLARSEAQRNLTFAPLVAGLSLTDLCISTEARYTRNPAVTEAAVAFQDHPGSFEHFPSGSFWAAPKKEGR